LLAAHAGRRTCLTPSRQVERLAHLPSQSDYAVQNLHLGRTPPKLDNVVVLSKAAGKNDLVQGGVGRPCLCPSSP